LFGKNNGYVKFINGWYVKPILDVNGMKIALFPYIFTHSHCEFPQARVNCCWVL